MTLKEREDFMKELEHIVEEIEFDDARDQDIYKDCQKICNLFKEYGICERTVRK